MWALTDHSRLYDPRPAQAHGQLPEHPHLLEKGTAYEISTNQTVAESWATVNCPGGPNRQFGSCEAQRGMIVQERAGETHLVAVAFDVTVTTERGVTDVTIVVS